MKRSKYHWSGECCCSKIPPSSSFSPPLPQGDTPPSSRLPASAGAKKKRKSHHRKHRISPDKPRPRSQPQQQAQFPPLIPTAESGESKEVAEEALELITLPNGEGWGREGGREGSKGRRGGRGLRFVLGCSFKYSCLLFLSPQTVRLAAVPVTSRWRVRRVGTAPSSRRTFTLDPLITPSSASVSILGARSCPHSPMKVGESTEALSMCQA